VPELLLSGLSAKHSRILLDASVAGRLDPDVCERVVRQVRGNPLALLEVAAELTPAQLAGASSLPDPIPVGKRLEQALLRRVRSLPAPTRSLLLVVAADPTGDTGLITRAAELLSIPVEAATAAEAAGVLTIRANATFPHALLRSAVYGAAPAEARRRVHWALAEATDAGIDQDRRAWHRAAASAAPDARVASDLERASGRAKARGGYSAEAVLLERAAELTTSRRRRSGRYLAAAGAHLAAGSPAKAAALVADTVPELTEPFQVAQAEKLRGELALELRNGDAAAATLLRAARRFAPLDPRLARDTHLAALEAAIYTSRLGGRGSLREAGVAARSAPPVSRSKPTAADLLLDGIGTLFVDGHEAAAPMLRLAIDAVRREEPLHCFRLGIFAASALWDAGALHDLSTRQVQIARDVGALTRLPLALHQLGAYEATVGHFAAAAACFDEASEIAAAAGNRAFAVRDGPMTVLVGAWRGHDVRAHAEACARDAAARGMTVVWRYMKYALAVLENGLGRYPAALAAARDAVEPESAISTPFAELAEAAARTGELDLAVSAVRRLEAATLAGGTPWGLGTLAQARALLAPDDQAEELYREAIDHLTHCSVTPQLARARLVYGEWLRRRRRPLDAREQLRSAHNMLGSMGATAFAERARAELRAAGGGGVARAVATQVLLTPQEARIADLAGAGVSNRQIAAQLFISPRTVEYHLHKVFRKLGISSRGELKGPSPGHGAAVGRS
jgi:DNA-binding CsgD family transcriptional regulator